MGAVAKSDFQQQILNRGEQICPPNGVYAIRAKLINKWFDGVLNIGTRPTFDGTKLQVESHLFNFNEIVYGETIEICFIEKIRNERKFSDMHALVKQINQDIAVANEILSQWDYSVSV